MGWLAMIAWMESKLYFDKFRISNISWIRVLPRASTNRHVCMSEWAVWFGLVWWALNLCQSLLGDKEMLFYTLKHFCKPILHNVHFRKYIEVGLLFLRADFELNWTSVQCIVDTNLKLLFLKRLSVMLSCTWKKFLYFTTGIQKYKIELSNRLNFSCLFHGCLKGGEIQCQWIPHKTIRMLFTF